MLGGQRALRRTEITIAFGTDGHLSGSTGCNRYMGSYTASASDFSTSPLGNTRMMCPPPIGDQERRFLDALQTATAWEIRRSRLKLTGTDLALAFRRT